MTLYARINNQVVMFHTLSTEMPSGILHERIAYGFKLSTDEILYPSVTLIRREQNTRPGIPIENKGKYETTNDSTFIYPKPRVIAYMKKNPGWLSYRRFIRWYACVYVCQRETEGERCTHVDTGVSGWNRVSRIEATSVVTLCRVERCANLAS